MDDIGGGGRTEKQIWIQIVSPFSVFGFLHTV